MGARSGVGLPRHLIPTDSNNGGGERTSRGDWSHHGSVHSAQFCSFSTPTVIFPDAWSEVPKLTSPRASVCSRRVSFWAEGRISSTDPVSCWDSWPGVADDEWPPVTPPVSPGTSGGATWKPARRQRRDRGVIWDSGWLHPGHGRRDRPTVASCLRARSVAMTCSSPFLTGASRDGRSTRGKGTVWAARRRAMVALARPTAWSPSTTGDPALHWRTATCRLGELNQHGGPATGPPGGRAPVRSCSGCHRRAAAEGHETSSTPNSSCPDTTVPSSGLAWLRLLGKHGASGAPPVMKGVCCHD